MSTCIQCLETVSGHLVVVRSTAASAAATRLAAAHDGVLVAPTVPDHEQASLPPRAGFGGQGPVQHGSDALPLTLGKRPFV